MAKSGQWRRRYSRISLSPKVAALYSGIAPPVSGSQHRHWSCSAVAFCWRSNISSRIGWARTHRRRNSQKHLRSREMQLRRGGNRTALQRYPGSAFAGMSLPGKDQPWYRVRVLQAGELRRVYGTTVIYVSAADARILVTQDAFTAAPHESYSTCYIRFIPVNLLGFRVAWLILIQFLADDNADPRAQPLVGPKAPLRENEHANIQ